MKLKVLVLAEKEKTRLLEIMKKNWDWRMRAQVQALLYFADGWRTKV